MTRFPATVGVVALAVTLFGASPSGAQSGSSYDWRSGNSYRWHSSPGGTTTVYGNNFRTGSRWNTTIQPNGSMRGCAEQSCYGKGRLQQCY